VLWGCVLWWGCATPPPPHVNFVFHLLWWWGGGGGGGRLRHTSGRRWGGSPGPPLPPLPPPPPPPPLRPRAGIGVFRFRVGHCGLSENARFQTESLRGGPSACRVRQGRRRPRCPSRRTRKMSESPDSENVRVAGLGKCPSRRRHRPGPAHTRSGPGTRPAGAGRGAAIPADSPGWGGVGWGGAGQGGAARGWGGAGCPAQSPPGGVGSRVYIVAAAGPGRSRARDSDRLGGEDSDGSAPPQRRRRHSACVRRSSRRRLGAASERPALRHR
jgi:hypothetical protein